MADEEWEDLEIRAISTIRLSLTFEIKYSVLNEKSCSDLWEKLKKLYMSKSLTNRLYLNKQLFELKMDERIDIRDQINKFNKCVTQLSSVKVKIDEEDQTIILLTFLSKSYETVVTMFLVGKPMLAMDEVSTTFLKTKNIKQPSSLSHTKQTFVMNSKPRHGRSISLLK